MPHALTPPPPPLLAIENQSDLEKPNWNLLLLQYVSIVCLTNLKSWVILCIFRELFDYAFFISRNISYKNLS